VTIGNLKGYLGNREPNPFKAIRRRKWTESYLIDQEVSLAWGERNKAISRPKQKAWKLLQLEKQKVKGGYGDDVDHGSSRDVAAEDAISRLGGGESMAGKNQNAGDREKEAFRCKEGPRDKS